jgi:excisionase family DNA binding protein
MIVQARGPRGPSPRSHADGREVQRTLDQKWETANAGRSKRKEIVELLKLAGLTSDRYHLEEPFLTTGEVAMVLRTTPRTVRNWADAGKIEAVRSLGGRRLFPLSAVQAALDSMVMATREPRASAPGGSSTPPGDRGPSAP